MADYVIENGRNRDVADMAQSMINGQSTEIDAMNGVLTELTGS